MTELWTGFRLRGLLSTLIKRSDGGRRAWPLAITTQWLLASKPRVYYVC
jgi:hypothetical protein